MLGTAGTTADTSVGEIPMARSLALIIGLFTLSNLVGDAIRPGFDANLWWIDLRFLPQWLANAYLLVNAASLLSYAAMPDMSSVRLRISVALLASLLIAVFQNVLAFYAHHMDGRISPLIPFPFSFFVLAALAVILSGMLRSKPGRSPVMLAAFAVAALLIVLPLAQMYCFGKTDYRRQADAIVVFGARAYANGTPSLALADRVRTGCDLYMAGYAPRIIFSGGPGDGEVHETEAMRRMAVQLGVPDSAIIVDEQGLNTQSTVANTQQIFHAHKVRSVLAVSHFYHLPRVKMCYQRAGMEVYTVPATQKMAIAKMPYLMAREVAAIWAYYVSPLVAGK
jgi:uncharacterized SAM-binding protein YcdF (DUF218 family)